MQRGFDGGVADDEFAGDLGVGEAARDEPQHLKLAWRQLGEPGRVEGRRWATCVALDHAARDRGGEERVAGRDHSGCVSEFLGACVFEEEAARASA